jgi:hypothetical protein
MPEAFAKPADVLTLAGIALADLVVLVSAQQYVPTLHLAKKSFWSGTKINQIRFGSYPNTGLVELARAEAVARAGRGTRGPSPVLLYRQLISKSPCFLWMLETHRLRTSSV